jgi:hypothetical protein
LGIRGTLHDWERLLGESASQSVADLIRPGETIPFGGMAICRFCETENPRFVDAHIIPRSFFKIVRGHANYSIMMRASGTTIDTPYYQAGPSDPEILCDRCEPKFSEWDGYGFEALGHEWRVEDAIRRSDGLPIAIPIKGLNYEKLSLFILAVLWRASVSKLVFYREVNLGEIYEERIRRNLQTREAPEPDQFAILIKFPYEQPYANVMISPKRKRLGELRFYQIFFPNISVDVKVDQRLAPNVIRFAMLQRREENYAFCEPHKGSAQEHVYRGFRKVVRQRNAQT